MSLLPAETSILDAKLDEIESLMTKYPPADIEVIHRFTPGLYIRECRIPAGTLLTSAIHRTEHPFVISQGLIEVRSENEGAVIYAAPHHGITKPGTRRVLFAVEDTIWTTFHVTEETDVAKIGAAIIQPHDNPLVAHDHPRLQQGWQSQPNNRIAP